jgi:hypothetical protein
MREPWSIVMALLGGCAGQAGAGKEARLEPPPPFEMLADEEPAAVPVLVAAEPVPAAELAPDVALEIASRPTWQRPVTRAGVRWGNEKDRVRARAAAQR